MKILNLGAGNRIIEGADNHDIIQHRPEINTVFNLNSFKWYEYIARDLNLPIEQVKDSYDRIELISVLEHLSRPLDALNECWQLLKSDGILVVKYPHKDSFTAYDDLTHRNYMTEYSLDYVDPRTYYGKHDGMFYTEKKWNILTPLENRVIIKAHDRGKRINVKMELRPIK